MKPTLKLYNQQTDASGKPLRGVRIRLTLDLKGGSVKKITVTYTETNPTSENKTLNEEFQAPIDKPIKKSEILQDDFDNSKKYFASK